MNVLSIIYYIYYTTPTTYSENTSFYMRKFDRRVGAPTIAIVRIIFLT